MANGEQGYLIVEIYPALHDDANLIAASRRQRVIPGCGDPGGAVDLGLTFAG